MRARTLRTTLALLFWALCACDGCGAPSDETRTTAPAEEPSVGPPPEAPPPETPRAGGQERRPACGGIAGTRCPQGLECVDDPSDDCDPTRGGADCGGICQAPGPGAGVACGRTTCPPGQICCNRSCGICTPPDGVCTQQMCE